MAKKPVARKVLAAKKTAETAKVKTRKPLRPAAKPAPGTGAVVPAKFKTPLSKAELGEFRQMLLDKRRAIVGDMSGIEAEALRTNRQDGTGDLSNMPTHPADVGTDNFEQEFTLGLLESERQLLQEINQALDRIDNNTYGVCVGTGQPIGVARLKARPWAKYCIEYARLIEKGLVRPGDERRQDGEAGDEPEDEDDDLHEDDADAEDHPADDVEEVDEEPEE